MKHLQRKPPSVTMSGMTFAGGRRTNLAVPTLTLLVLLAAGLTIQTIVDRAMRDVIGNQLKTIRDSSVGAIRLWFREEETNCKRIAKIIHDQALRFETASTENVLSKDFLASSEDYQQLKQTLETNISDPQYVGWALLKAASSKVLVAWDESLVGQPRIEIPSRALNKACEGDATMSVPFRSPLQDRRTGEPIMASLAPITDASGNTRAVLAILLRPEEEFTGILEVSWSGRSGQTYAFDRTGLMITRCRFEDDLRVYDLMPDDKSVSSVLEVQLRDPEVDLRSGVRSLKPRENQIFTKMALDATRGGTSLSMEGYSDYRGVTVIGAWAWLEDYSMGLATEVDVQEAYRPLRVLYWSNASLFALLLIAASVIAFTTARVGRAERKATKETRIARKLGQYQLEEQLGTGGMGTVYKGQHALLMRPVAIKVLDSGMSDHRNLIRFQREVELTSQLHNPHTIMVYDFGQTADGEFYYVMEYLDGIDLGMLVREYTSLSAARVISILTQICGSLTEAHSKGLIHRDIKPANIMLTERGGLYDFAKLLDFGLVKESSAESANLTHEGSLTGTPMYMAPEAIRNPKDVDARSDIYAVGAVGYFLVTGKPLFDVTGTVDAILNQCQEEPDRPSERAGKSISRDFEDLIMQCLAKDPDERPESAEELARLLMNCSDAGGWNQQESRKWWTETFRGWQRHSTVLTGNESVLHTVLGQNESLIDRRLSGSDVFDEG